MEAILVGSIVAVLMVSNYLVQRFNRKRRIALGAAAYFALFASGAKHEDAFCRAAHNFTTNRDEVEQLAVLCETLERESRNIVTAGAIADKVFSGSPNH